MFCSQFTRGEGDVGGISLSRVMEERHLSSSGGPSLLRHTRCVHASQGSLHCEFFTLRGLFILWILSFLNEFPLRVEADDLCERAASPLQAKGVKRHALSASRDGHLREGSTPSADGC